MDALGQLLDTKLGWANGNDFHPLSSHRFDIH